MILRFWHQRRRYQLGTISAKDAAEPEGAGHVWGPPKCRTDNACLPIGAPVAYVCVILMPDSPSKPPPTPAWRYTIPNAITLAGLVIGLAATLQALRGEWVDSGWLIILAVLTDKLDGTAARLLRATSAIGVQLDSFADFVAFGVAPAALVLSLVTGPIGGGSGVALWSSDAAVWLAYAMSTTYVLCACLRLAKFNVLTERDKVAADEHPETKGQGGPGAFLGIPSTFAGAFVAVAVILAIEYRIEPLQVAMPALVFLLGLMMVSRFPFPKVGKYPQAWLNWWQILNAIAGYICGVFRVLPEYLGAILLIYLVTGFLWGFIHRAEFRPPARNASEA